ncbi:ADR350Wp [Eremothecium gossypii ATCC 10895]|uniref:Phospholipid-transporting ATPase n=1 Tax=Eremothecium gossypii (strain ATCC 10895 / CBS 109.51 / FGSC 9923 / NRRL Y-1056) TaxID=284811 RepID=Q759C7_EREGS|nr:ADR350Wp [Eremothecium gossypii ATCC 10895]AAS52270.2 ADR350Wp [Eremothecium gossypii ATCC 10895]AEY96568.1 FADR350Wp [Eremothecium gossypii FDAG1]
MSGSRDKHNEETLFDIDFLDDRYTPEPARPVNDSGSRSGPIIDSGIDDLVQMQRTGFPQEVIDLDDEPPFRHDDSIENDLIENPFDDERGQQRYLASANRLSVPQPSGWQRLVGGLRDSVGGRGTENSQYQSFEMQDYRDTHSGDRYQRSRNKFNLKALFDHYVLRKPAAADTGAGEPRVIYINERRANGAMGYGDNHISTTKYNAATFLPKFLFQEFSKYANLFFLFTSIIQQVPNVTPTNRFTTIGTLIVVLVVSAIKESVEDLKRSNSDKELNHSRADVYSDEMGQFISKKWIDIAVGDIIRVRSEEAIPADLIVLSSSEPEGLCYIETANLDGETNLKIKQARPETSKILDVRELSAMRGKILSEQPNTSLYTYEGTMILHNNRIPLSPDQILLRGATLRNTAWIFGIVIFTGHETKLMRNATATPIKRTAVERVINLQIVALFGVLICLSLISSFGNLIVMYNQKENLSYLYLQGTNMVALFFKNILTFWILFSNLVPISLFVTVEMIKYYQAYMIASDLDLFHEESNMPTVVRTSSLVEELGQIEYIFSDKTGTLTQNVMEFKSCSIAGRCYIQSIPEDKDAAFDEGIEVGYRTYDDMHELLHTPGSGDGAIIDEFLTLLSICHTVIPEFQENGSIKYQAASPDEGALVQGAADLGYKFIIRKPNSVTILREDITEEVVYELLNICEFNSTRKRMSAIFRFPDNSIRLLCKGADTVILERLAATSNPYVAATLRHLEDYAAEGLRTLCIASRTIPESEYEEWSKLYDAAATTMHNRSEELDKVAEMIEKGLVLLGATAIEDKLQDGVPETIHTLQQAGIKVWVLTGDRQETAINIGMSCKLLSEDMNLLIVNEDTKESTRNNLIDKLRAINDHQISQQDMNTLALVIDGKSLGFALEPDLEEFLLAIGKMCRAVICCRVSPLQKALVVKMVKRRTKSLLLAIGDGANDVSMIQAAHVGVGISGMEGMQAARSADFALGQFKYLKKLLLVHGSWSYQRISQAILYSFYKNIALYMTQFWYVLYNAFSGQSIMESWTLTFYNVFFTVAPPFVLGVFDQFVSSRLLDRYPQLYTLGQKGQFFSVTIFWGWVINGFYHSLITFVGSIMFYRYGAALAMHGETADHWVWGVAIYTTSIIIVLGKAALITNQWTKFTVLAIPGSLVFWLLFFPIYAYLLPGLNVSKEYYGIVSHVYGSFTFWAMCYVLPVLALLRDLLWKYYKRTYTPESYHVVQEMQKYDISDNRPRIEQFQKAIRKVRQVQRMKKQRGFAFSQSEEAGQDRIVRMYDTTQKRGTHGELQDASMNPFKDL